MVESKSSQRLLWAILGLALFIRLIVLILNGWTALPSTGGDEFWYLVNGQGLFSSEPTGFALGYPYAANNLGVAPLYLIFNGAMQTIFGYLPALGAIRFTQIIMSVMVCYFAYDLGRLLTHDVRVGFVAGLAMAISIVWVIEPLNIMTETLYITLTSAGIWCYCRWIMNQLEISHWSIAVIIGILLGLATLTRAVGILFPIGIMGHVIFAAGRPYWKKGLQIACIILVSYGLVISTWTVYNLVRYERFIIVSNQFFPTLWRGATEEDGSPSENDTLLGDQTAQEQSTKIIASDPTAYIALRTRELIGAYLQPHGTLAFGGESLKALAQDWVQSGFSINSLQRMVTAESFVPKLLIYIWHYGALVGGIIGMWLTRQQWRVSLVLIGFIAYTTLLHFILQALPRYMFPTYVFYMIFASVTVITVWDLFMGQNKKEAT
ncbi:MAG: glycosyltransferase family 39 protein [Chloroflexota bacterium]